MPNFNSGLGEVRASWMNNCIPQKIIQRNYQSMPQSNKYIGKGTHGVVIPNQEFFFQIVFLQNYRNTVYLFNSALIFNKYS